MDENHPIKECLVQDFHVSVVSIEWQDGRKRTLAITSGVDLITIGILVKGGATVEEIDQRFAGKFCQPVRGMVDVLKIIEQRSAN
jgi:hypothetical protein